MLIHGNPHCHEFEVNKVRQKANASLLAYNTILEIEPYNSVAIINRCRLDAIRVAGFNMCDPNALHIILHNLSLDVKPQQPKANEIEKMIVSEIGNYGEIGTYDEIKRITYKLKDMTDLDDIFNIYERKLKILFSLNEVKKARAFISSLKNKYDSDDTQLRISYIKGMFELAVHVETNESGSVLFGQPGKYPGDDTLMLNIFAHLVYQNVYKHYGDVLTWIKPHLDEAEQDVADKLLKLSYLKVYADGLAYPMIEDIKPDMPPGSYQQCCGDGMYHPGHYR